MTKEINYEMLSNDIIEEYMDKLDYNFFQVMLSIINFCERREIKLDKSLLLEGDSEDLYNIVSKTFDEEIPGGLWKRR